MIDLGIVKPGSTIRIPFNTFKGADGSSITMTNFAAADILIYKDGSTTERASTSGFTATTDFDSKTGKQLLVIDLADNTTSGFFTAGSEYLIAIDAVTVDTFTTGGWVARFTIGYPGATLDTTIATLASQTSFTLTVGPAEDDALNDMWVIIHDIDSAVRWSKALVLDYTGSTKTVTLAAAPTFTIAAGDNISVMGPAPMQPTTAGRKLDVSATGEAGLDFNNILSSSLVTLHSLTITGNTTFTGTTTHTGNVALSNGMTITQATTNGHGITVTGNGSGHGVYFVSGGTNSNGLLALGSGAGSGIGGWGGATGNGFSGTGGATSGDGLHVVASTSGAGIHAVGAGGTPDINATLSRVTLVDTTTTNADMRGTDAANILALTGDTGITLEKALEMLAAFVAGKVSVSSGGGISTYTYKMRDGTTTSFTALCSETDGTRATTGSLS